MAQQQTGKTFFIHLRAKKADGSISNTGGKTIAYREAAGGIVFAVARCSPHDNFSRAQGRVMAAGRLNSPRFVQAVPDITEQAFRAAVYNPTGEFV